MEKITLPKSTFDNLFDHILSVNFAETWNMYETDSERINPYVVFETAKWDKLLSLLNIYINKNVYVIFNLYLTKLSTIMKVK